MPSFPPPHLFVANVLLLPSKSDELQHKSRIWPQIYTISKYYNVYISVKVKCNGANVTEIRRYFEKKHLQLSKAYGARRQSAGDRSLLYRVSSAHKVSGRVV